MRGEKKHILVTGAHRSGTTWVGRTLAESPEIEYVHEPFNIELKNPGLGLGRSLDVWFTDYFSSEHQAKMRESFDCLLRKSPTQKAAAAIREEGVSLAKLTQLCKSLFVTPPRYIIKDPIALFSAGWLHETYHLSVICMIRNPLAFVGSLKKAGWDFDFQHIQRQERLMRDRLQPFASEIEKQAQNAGSFVDRASLLWNILHFVILEYKKAYPSWLFIRHEDLATKPIEVFQEMFDYVGVEMSKRIRDYVKEFTSGDNPVEAESTRYQPLNSKASVASWKKRLSDDEVEIVRSRTAGTAALLYPEMA